MRSILLAALAVGAVALAGQPSDTFDVVIAGGRVIDPESGLNDARTIGISGGVIRAISGGPLTGHTTIDACGMIVAPGFIDLNHHAQRTVNPAVDKLKVLDGVTTALELEVGTDDIDGWYDARAGKSLLNYGVSIGHIPTRMAVMNDPGDLLPSGPAAHRAATAEEIAAITGRIEHGLSRGAMAVGFGFAYTPVAARRELLNAFEAAARAGASAYVHIRGGDPVAGTNEAIGIAAEAGVALKIAHVHSSGGAQTRQVLSLLTDARTRGVDVTTDMYPYIATQTRIESARFDGWESYSDDRFKSFLRPATGERLTRETFAKYRKHGGWIMAFSNTEEVVHAAAAHPLTMIASDGGQVLVHPRTAGTYSRVLGPYVRDGVLPLTDALRKMTIMPAQRLERRVPSMRKKGRVEVGADADLVVFDPQRIADQATYEQPTRSSIGIRATLVNGVAVVRDGRLVEGVAPGRAVRAAVK